MQKQKKHDSLEDMALFSWTWECFPVLYDNSARNDAFKKDWKAANIHLQKCYADMASALAISVSDVKAWWMKYKDAVTKALKQYADNLTNGTNECPTPAALKLSIFFWLLPFSANYQPDLMDGKPLDAYLEKILQAHLNKMCHEQQDITELTKHLALVKQFMHDVGKPKDVKIMLNKLSFDELSAIAFQHKVTFLAGYSEMTVFFDDSVQTRLIDALDVHDIGSLPYAICMWMSRTWDPAFQWAAAGMEHKHKCAQNGT